MCVGAYECCINALKAEPFSNPRASMIDPLYNAGTYELTLSYPSSILSTPPPPSYPSSLLTFPPTLPLILLLTLPSFLSLSLPPSLHYFLPFLLPSLPSSLSLSLSLPPSLPSLTFLILRLTLPFSLLPFLTPYHYPHKSFLFLASLILPSPSLLPLPPTLPIGTGSGGAGVITGLHRSATQLLRVLFKHNPIHRSAILQEFSPLLSQVRYGTARTLLNSYIYLFNSCLKSHVVQLYSSCIWIFYLCHFFLFLLFVIRCTVYV